MSRRRLKCICGRRFLSIKGIEACLRKHMTVVPNGGGDVQCWCGMRVREWWLLYHVTRGWTATIESHFLESKMEDK
jgi:hypothetical protein